MAITHAEHDLALEEVTVTVVALSLSHVAEMVVLIAIATANIIYADTVISGIVSAAKLVNTL